MEKYCGVQQKISCVFKTVVVEETSKKRGYQPYKVIASQDVRQEINLKEAKATEKFDGTCCYVANYDGKPWLWARLDRKLNKMTEKKFKKFQTLHRAWQVNGMNESEPSIDLNIDDFKSVPPCWIPALGVDLKDGVPKPDQNGHIPGWVPIEPTSKQYCWHLSTVDLVQGVALVLRWNSEDNRLEIVAVRMEELLGQTMELIGTNINANAYKLGSKQSPVHYLIQHGSIPCCQSLPELDYIQVKQWLQDSKDGSIEGVVWHCEDGSLYKLHRHHLDLPWPVEETRLSNRRTVVDIDTSIIALEDWGDRSCLPQLVNINGLEYNRLSEVLKDH